VGLVAGRSLVVWFFPKTTVDFEIPPLKMTTPRLDNDESTSTKTLAKMIDHTYLKAFGGPEDIERLCQEAKQYGFATVAVNPFEVERCVELLKDDDSSDGEVRVGAAIGFPLGQSTTPVKVYETKDAIQRGASEIDFVVNIRALQSGNLSLVRHEMEQIAQVCGSTGTTCKVILETCYLTDAQKVQVCEMACQAGVDFVKTSTGFGTAGASVEE
jgi:deoxyribose-phosphate aldolase